MPSLRLSWALSWIFILSTENALASSGVESAAVCRELEAGVGNITILASDSQYASLSTENW